MDDINYLLRELCVIVSSYEQNGEYIRFTFCDRNMFVKYIKHITNCKMSSDLSKSIHVMWAIQILRADNAVINLFDVIKDFSDCELDKIIASENQKYFVVFPRYAINLIKDQLNEELDEQILEPDSIFGGCMDCDTDDLIYSDTDDFICSDTEL